MNRDQVPDGEKPPDLLRDGAYVLWLIVVLVVLSLLLPGPARSQTAEPMVAVTCQNGRVARLTNPPAEIAVAFTMMATGFLPPSEFVAFAINHGIEDEELQAVVGVARICHPEFTLARLAPGEAQYGRFAEPITRQDV